MPQDLLTNAVRLDLVQVFLRPLQVHPPLECFEGRHSESVAAVVLDREVRHPEANFAAPGPEDTLSHLPNVPEVRVLVEVPPPLQNVDLVEPLLEDLPLLEQIKFGEDLQLEVTVLLDLVDVGFPPRHDDLHTKRLNVVDAGYVEVLLAPFVRSVLLECPEHLLRAEAELEELSSLHLLQQLAPGDECSGFGP